MQVNWNSIRQTIARKFPQVPSITTEQLASWLEDPDRMSPLLFDVRESAEYDVSHLRYARQATDAKAILEVMDGLSSADESARETPIVVYCSVGYRSAKVAKSLMPKHNGKVFNLDGSIFQWFNEGRDVWRDSDSDEVRVKEVHPYDARWGKLLTA